MNPALSPIELGDFAFDILERPGPNEWLALVTPREDVERAAAALIEELKLIGDTAPGNARFRRAVDLVDFLRSQKKGLKILSGFEEFSLEDWNKMDEDRSLLSGVDTRVLVLSEESLGNLFRHAPNFSSWVGGAAWRLIQQDHTLSPIEREARLAVLRTWAHLTDAEVIEMAERKTLPGDPPYAEWLVLLGRGDLIG